MDKLLNALRLFILNNFTFKQTTHDTHATERLSEIQATQQQILHILEDLQRDEVPRNINRIYKIGPARTALFLNDLLPQVYLTLVSVLQGVALAVLIDQFSFDYAQTSPATYGYTIASFLIIVAFWHSYLSAIFDSRWPFRFIDTLLFFLAAATESIAIRNISTPAWWCLAIGSLCIVTAIIYFRQRTLLAELIATEVFEDPNEGAMRIRGIGTICTFFLAAAVIAFVFVPITSANPQNIIAPVIAVVMPVIYIFYAVSVSIRFGVDAIG